MSGKGKYLLIVASFAVLAVIAACSEEQVPTQEPVEFNPTEAAEVEKPQSEPEAPPTQDNASGVSDEGDPVVGQALFASFACSGCHLTGPDKLVGPGLAGVYDRAGSRTSLDADAYIKQSILDPEAFIVDTFAPLMPSFDGRASDDDVRNLIAYLKTLN